MQISVVVPVFNEAENIMPLFQRLKDTLESIGVSYEIIFVNDGSSDSSLDKMMLARTTTNNVKIIDFTRNFGQHSAIVAGFKFASGNMVATIDADLQNPPEDIENIFEQFKLGFDYVGTIRRKRNDNAFRKYASVVVNKIRKIITKIPITDQGCMMRGYSQEIAKKISDQAKKHTFIPLLGFQLAKNPTEIVVGHSARNSGKSKYSLLALIKLTLNLFKSASQTNEENKIEFEIKDKIGF